MMLSRKCKSDNKLTHIYAVLTRGAGNPAGGLRDWIDWRDPILIALSTTYDDDQRFGNHQLSYYIDLQ